MERDTTAIILAGGKSSRMGENKQLLNINGKKVIEIIADLLKEIFRKIIVITNSPDDYKFLEIPMFKDIFINKGPLAGIHSGLINSSTEKNFIISSDVPLISKELIYYLLNYKTDKPILVCKDNSKIHPLIGIYSKSVAPKIEKILSKQNTVKKSFSVISLLNNVESEIIDLSGRDFYNESLFFNLNNYEDYMKIQFLLKNKN